MYKIRIILIRHAKTRGNTERRYTGITDEPLLPGTVITCGYPAADVVISSPLKRCVSTAELIYPGKIPVICGGLREIDFGKFENKTHRELENDSDYIKWIESGGSTAIPGGEPRERFIRRSFDSYRSAVKRYGGGDIAFIVHGGTIRSIMSSLFGGDFYGYMLPNLGAVSFEADSEGNAADGHTYEVIRGARSLRS